MKILVIGSNSFSGSNFVNFLLDLGYDVIGVSRSEEYNKIFLPYYLNKNKKNFKFVKINLNHNISKLINLIKKEKINKIVNFSAQGEVRSSFIYPKDFFITNTLSQIALIENLKNIDFFEKFVQISTPEVYGTTSKSIKENFNFFPSSPYAASKGSFDLYLISQFKSLKFPVAFVRSSNVFGPCQQLYRIIPKTMITLINKKKISLHGGGKAKKNFIYIDDVSNGEYLVLDKGKIGEIYHFSSNKQPISIKNLVKKICKILNKNYQNSTLNIEERLGQDSIYNINSYKSRNELGWRSNIDLDLGLLETYRWIYDNFNFLKKQNLNYIHKK